MVRGSRLGMLGGAEWVVASSIGNAGEFVMFAGNPSYRDHFCRNSLRSILPTLLLGSSSRNSMYLGRL